MTAHLHAVLCPSPAAFAVLALVSIATPRANGAQVPTQPNLPGTPTPIPMTMPLSITSPILSGPVYAGVRTTVKVKVANAKNGTTITVKPLRPASGTCGFLTRPDAAPATAVVNGATEVTVAGMFPHPATGVATTCAFSAEVTATKSDGSVTTTTVNSTNVPITASQTYVLTNTSAWRQKFAFALDIVDGTCSGTSAGPTSYPVGLLTTEGGQPLADLTFRIRSGPGGTRCGWQSQPIMLPEGVRLMEMEVTSSASSRCIPSSKDSPSSFGFQNAGNPVMSRNDVVGPNPLGAGYPVNGVQGTYLYLTCSATGVNDHSADAVIKTLTFIGPPNVPGFP